MTLIAATELKERIIQWKREKAKSKSAAAVAGGSTSNESGIDMEQSNSR